MEAVGKVVNGKFVPFGNTGNADRTILQRIQALETGKLDKIGNASQTTVTFEQAAQLANVQSGDSMSVALGKLSKLYAELESGQLGNAFSGDIAGNRALISDANGKITSSDITSTELNALDGISGNVQEKLTELTGKFVTRTKYAINVETDEEVNMYLNQLYSELKDNEISYKTLFLRVVSSALKEGGAWDIFTSRTNTEYGYQIAISYFASSIKTRRLYSGVWSGWDTYVRTSDLGYVDCIVATSANNTITIFDAPDNSFYIPVVVGHTDTNNVNDHVFWAGSWRIHSNVSQNTTVRFYKYPV